MKKAILYTLIGGVLCVGQTPVAHAAADTTEPAHILIVEIQTGGANDATEEFVELYNPNDTDVDVTDWQLQYRAASGTATQTWGASTTKATLSCPATANDCRVVIPARGRIVITHTIANIAGALPMTGGLSGTGGQIRFVQPGAQPIVHDLVGYGTAMHAETAPAPAPTSGKSIKRILGGEQPVDTNNNAADFMAGCGDPTPGVDDTGYIPRATGCEEPVIIPPDPTPSDQPDTQPTDSPEGEVQTGQGGANPTAIYLPVIITEVFADPASPQQDSADEFIELYNPNDSAITLQNYRLQTGSDYRYSFTLGDTPLGPRMYLAIPSAVSKLSLANSGSGVRLLDPSGAVAYEAPSYGDAKEGQSWIQDESGWKWTLTPTPGAANVASTPPPKVVAATSITAKKKATAKTTAPKVATPKPPKAPAAKKTTNEKPKVQPVQQTASAAFNPQYWLLIPLGTLAVSYAAYEYRHGISRTARTSWAKVRGKEPPAKE